MQRFSWPEMRRYWEAHSARLNALDREHDPEGLGNVCIPGAPLWLNEYYARFQKLIYSELFALLPRSDNPRALDVGCGTGRWCRFLSQHGYRTVGIDLQPETIDANRRRYPDCEFFVSSIQEFFPPERFDLVSSVTVLLHIPFEEQEAAIAKLRALTKDGGFAIVLENIRDQLPHVFSNTIEGWQKKFSKWSFVAIAVRRYDYSPCLRLHEWARRRLRRLLGEDDLHARLVPEHFGHFAVPSTSRSRVRAGLHMATELTRRIAVVLDGMTEPILVRSHAGLPTGHVGFLFKAV